MGYRSAAWLGAAAFGLLLSAAGCEDHELRPHPQTANIVFTGVAIDTLDGARYHALEVQNQGTSRAYAVRVYWTAAGNDSFTFTDPIDLDPGQTGRATTLLLHTIAWIVPTAPDSIRWSASAVPWREVVHVATWVDTDAGTWVAVVQNRGTIEVEGTRVYWHIPSGPTQISLCSPSLLSPGGFGRASTVAIDDSAAASVVIDSIRWSQ
jgi:hypothetical protein